MIRSRLIAAIIGLALISPACSKSAFEKKHDRMVAQNPSDITFELKTVDNKKVSRESERIPLYSTYVAKHSGLWQIEILDNWNSAGASDKAYISDGREQTEQSLGSNSVICCGSRHVWLSLEPTRVPYQLRVSERYFENNPRLRYLRLRHSGKYQVYAESHRVFPRSATLVTMTGLGIVLTSNNLLNLEIVPNDPAWDREQLRQVIKVLDDPKSAGSAKVEACERLLFDLNSDEAVAESIRRIRENKSCGGLSTAINSRNASTAMGRLRDLVNSPDLPIPEGADSAIVDLLVRSKLGNRFLEQVDPISLTSNSLLLKGSTDEDWKNAQSDAKLLLKAACLKKSPTARASCTQYLK